MTRQVDVSDVQRLIDEAQIRDLHLRYCRGIDRLDWALVESCYHPGAVDDHGPFNGDARAFMAWEKRFLEEDTYATAHLTGDQLIEIDGDVAWHEACCVCVECYKATDDRPAVDRVVHFRTSTAWNAGTSVGASSNAS